MEVFCLVQTNILQRRAGSPYHLIMKEPDHGICTGVHLMFRRCLLTYLLVVTTYLLVYLLTCLLELYVGQVGVKLCECLDILEQNVAKWNGVARLCLVYRSVCLSVCLSVCVHPPPPSCCGAG